MRKILVLLVLAAMLLLLNRLAQMAQDWHYVVPAQPGELLYASTFDAHLDQWELYEGRLSARIEDSALRLDVATEDSLPFSTAGPYFADFDLRVLARPVAGPINNGYGVIFRAQDPQNYYMFLVSSDGYYQVRRSVDGEQKILSDWIPSSLVVQGLNVENWLRVIAVGETFRFIINGEQVKLCIPLSATGVSTYRNGCVEGEMLATLTDDSVAAGHLGVVAQTLNEPGVAVSFDNFLVYGPE